MAKRRPPVVNDTFGELYLGAITTDLLIFIDMPARGVQRRKQGRSY
jgi:hypothetical protein